MRPALAALLGAGILLTGCTGDSDSVDITNGGEFRFVEGTPAGEVIPPDDLSVQIWGYETFGSRNYVEAHVSRLRGKLADCGADGVIGTVRGVGYMVR